MKNLFSSASPSVVLSVRPADTKEVQVTLIPSKIFWEMSFCLVLLSYIHDSQMSKFKGSVTRNNWDTRLEQHSPWQWRLCGHTSLVAPCWCYSPALLPCVSVTQGFGVCMCTVPLVLVAFCRMYRTRAFSLRAQVLPNLQGLMTSSCW